MFTEILMFLLVLSFFLFVVCVFCFSVTADRQILCMSPENGESLLKKKNKPTSRRLLRSGQKNRSHSLGTLRQDVYLARSKSIASKSSYGRRSSKIEKSFEKKLISRSSSSNSANWAVVPMTFYEFECEK